MEAGAVLRNTKEELHPNSSSDVKLHESTYTESPTRNLEAGGRPIHYPLKRRISDLASDQYQKRRKLIDDFLREKDTDSDGTITIKEEPISTLSMTSGCHQILTIGYRFFLYVLERQEKGKIKIGDSTNVPMANEYQKSFLLLNETHDFKHRADRLKGFRTGPESTDLELEVKHSSYTVVLAKNFLEASSAFDLPVEDLIYIPGVGIADTTGT